MDVRIAASLLFLTTTAVAQVQGSTKPPTQAPAPAAAQDPEKPAPTVVDQAEALSREKARLEREIEFARARVAAARSALTAKFKPHQRTWREIDAGTLTQTNTTAVAAQARPQAARVASKPELDSLGPDGMVLVNGAVIRRPQFESVMSYLRTVPNSGTDEQRAQRILMELIRTEVACTAFPDTEALVVAGQVVQRLANGSTPAEMARMYGVIPGATADGRLDLMRNSALGPVLEQAAFTTDVGQITTPIRTSMGAVVLKIAAFEKGASPELDKVQVDAIVVPYTQDSFALQKVLDTAMAGQVQLVGRDQSTVDMLPALFRPAAARAKPVDVDTLKKTLTRLEAERARLESMAKDKVDEAVQKQLQSIVGQIEKLKAVIESAEKDPSKAAKPDSGPKQADPAGQGKQ
ncbi:MAG: peptidylprolyl isomerase [Planctomycetota bacterium]